MSELIEKLARALANELARQDGYGPHELWELEPGLRLAWIDQNGVDMGALAKAAITCLADDLTPEMVEAAHAAFRDGHGCSEDLESGTVRAALTAALRSAVGE